MAACTPFDWCKGSAALVPQHAWRPRAAVGTRGAAASCKIERRTGLVQVPVNDAVAELGEQRDCGGNGWAGRAGRAGRACRRQAAARRGVRRAGGRAGRWAPTPLRPHSLSSSCVPVTVSWPVQRGSSSANARAAAARPALQGLSIAASAPAARAGSAVSERSSGREGRRAAQALILTLISILGSDGESPGESSGGHVCVANEQ